ncbi:hypothetical protein [Methylosarcina fibrata]|uniref:hypothetical protein n=1 Tax=Methylosarcina fibrata TaxID=105972 RepID=UPI00037D0D77|nr:hypothetical protein [Methylosarcina fibrata]
MAKFIGSPWVRGKLKNQIFLGNKECVQQLQSQIQAKPGELQDILQQCMINTGDTKSG